MNAISKGLCGFLLFGAAASPAAAQLVTDRPDFTESTVTVPDGRLQLEAGYTYVTADAFTAHEIGEGLLRYGLIPGLELRLGIPSFVSSSIEAGPGEDERSGFGDMSVGMKLGLYEAGMAEGLPSASLLLGSGIPTGESDVTGSDGWEPEAILALGWQFTPSLGLGANVGYAQRDPVGDADRFDEWSASVSLGLPLTSSLGAFIEYYAIRPDVDFDGADEDVIDGGVTFLLSPTLQLDGRIGFDVSEDGDGVLFGVGFAKLF